MPQTELDRLDCKILELLSANARKPFLEIARECNVSGASVHQRVQKLIASGAIQGFDTLINPAEVHYTTGKYDLLIKLYAKNNRHLLQLIHDKLQGIVSGRTETLISFKEEFRRQIPIDINE